MQIKMTMLLILVLTVQLQLVLKRVQLLRLLFQKIKISLKLYLLILIKGMTDSVLNPSNYTVGDKKLPAGTDIKFVDNKNKVLITLPEAFVTVNGNLLL